MKVFTAPEQKDNPEGLPTVFLAGGIVKCGPWQDHVIERLGKYDHALILNPRRSNYPWDDPTAEREQITWEFHGLNHCDVFSMWFVASESDQPVCMYELGRQLAFCPFNPSRRVVLGIEPGYNRESDVRIQTALAYPGVQISDTLDAHSDNILKATLEMAR